MKPITVVNVNDRWYIPGATQLQEIHYSIVMEWQKVGYEILTIRGEDYV
jgi:hypothetical protein